MRSLKNSSEKDQSEDSIKKKKTSMRSLKNSLQETNRKSLLKKKRASAV